MLPENTWQPWHPRAFFPVFADVQNTVDFIVQRHQSFSLRALAMPAYAVLKKRKSTSDALRDYGNILLSRPYHFRGVLVDRAGTFVAEWPLGNGLRAGDYFSADINHLCREAGIKLMDGQWVLIANRGRADLMGSSPGSATMRYVGANYVAGFRTGLFTRVINPVNGKKHFGFTGINPQVMVHPNLVASVLLINHSSDPAYDRAVAPTIRLYRNNTEYLEAPFGDIPSHGALERRVTDLFPQAEAYLAANQGRGLTVAHASGVSLASLHLLRSPKGDTLGIDHSRPAYTNVVDYL